MWGGGGEWGDFNYNLTNDEPEATGQLMSGTLVTFMDRVFQRAQ